MTPAREREAQMRGKRAWVIPLVVLIGLLSLAPLLRFVAFTGRVTGERRSLVSPLNLTLAEDALIPLDLAPGRLTSLSVSGRVAGEASVWLDAGNVSYLIWESREPGLPGITGQVIEGEPSGAENTSTEESGQSPAQPSDETPDAEEANGSIPLETIPKAPADEPTDSLPGSEAENVSGNSSPMAEQGTPDAFPEAGVENLPDSADNASIVAETLIEPQADDPAETGENGSVAVENNNPAALPLREQCAETCQLPGTLSQGASLRIEVHGVLVLEELQYTLAENQAPEFLFNGTLAMRETLDLNLSEFFSDPEGARLTFAALADTLDTSLTDDVLTLTAAPQTSGVHNVTLIASDGELSTRTELSIRVSPVEAANESVNATIEIHVPVRWLRTVDSSERLSLPRQAFNVSVDGEPYALAASDDILVDLADRSGIVQVEYYTPAPEAVEEELSPYRKLVTVSAELPYENVLAYTDITPSPAAAVRLFWLVNGSRLPHPAALLDADLDGLVERVEWMVPHLSKQTFEISITILNPVSYLRDGDTWTVYFNTTGVADLHINSTNANWTEMLSDLPDTVDEMTFLDIACGNVPLTDRLRIVDVSGTVWNFSALTPSVSLKPAQFLVENWSCNETGSFSNTVHIAGYAELLFDYGGMKALAVDPPVTSSIYSESCVAITEWSNPTADWDISSGCHVDQCNPSVLTISLDMSGYEEANISISWSTTGTWEANDVVNLTLYNGTHSQLAFQIQFANSSSGSEDVNITLGREGGNLSVNWSCGIDAATEDFTFSSLDVDGYGFIGPAISNVQPRVLNSSHVLVNWTTNDASNSTVIYNSSSTLQYAGSDNDDTVHNVTLSGLSEGTFYTFNVSSCVQLSGSERCNVTGKFNFTTAYHAPSLSAAAATPDRAPNGSAVNISISITDTEPVTAIALLYYPNGSNFRNLTLANTSATSYWNASYTVLFSVPGYYNATILANNSGGSANITLSFAPFLSLNASQQVDVDGAFADWAGVQNVSDTGNDNQSGSAQRDIVSAALANNATHLTAYLRVNTSLDFGAVPYRLYVQLSSAAGLNTTPDSGLALPINWSYRIVANGSCRVYGPTQEAQATREYNFSGITGPSSTHIAHYNDTKTFGGPDGNGTEFTTYNYSLLNSSDNLRMNVTATNYTNVAAERFRFTLQDWPEDISSLFTQVETSGISHVYIDPTCDDVGAGQYIWNFSSTPPTWSSGSQEYFALADKSGNVTYQSGIASYVNESLHLSLLLRAGPTVGGPCVLVPLIGVDLVRVTTNITVMSTALANCSVSNDSDELELSVRLADLNISSSELLNVTFESGSKVFRYDIAPDYGSLVSFQLLGVDAVGPSVKGASASPEKVLNGTPINITANVTDTAGVSAVYTRVYYPNGSEWRNITLFNSSHPDIWTNATVSVPGAGPWGSYNATLIANDTNGNVNSTVAVSFAPYLTLSAFAQVDMNASMEDWGGVQNVSDPFDDFPYSTSLWNRTYANASDDRATGMAADEGTLYVTGYETGASGAPAAGTQDWRVMALNASTGTSIWNRTFANTSADSGNAVALDAGRLFVVGSETNTTAGSDEDWRVMALNASTGASLWNRTYANSSVDAAFAAAADSGRLFVGGSETGVAGGNGDTLDWRIMALNVTDGSSLWNRTYSQSETDRVVAIAARDGLVYAAGREGTTNINWRVMVFNATTGNALWNSTEDSGGTDIANAAAAEAGWVYVGGRWNTNGEDWRIRGYNTSDGTVRWTATFDLNGTQDMVTALALDAGTLFAAGRATLDGPSGELSYDWRISALRADSGLWLWNRSYSNLTPDEPQSIAVDGSGRVFVAGYENASGTADWRIMALQHEDATPDDHDLSGVALANNATHLTAYVRVDDSIDFSDASRYYRLFIAANSTSTRNTTPDTSLDLPLNWSHRVTALNATHCGVYNTSATAAGIYQYNFSGVSSPSSTHVATFNDSFGAVPPTFLAGEETGTANYTLLNRSDSSTWNHMAGEDVFRLYPWQRFDFEIDPVSTLGGIRISHNGMGYARLFNGDCSSDNEYGMILLFWNVSKGNWSILASSGGPPQTLIDINITQNLDHYVNGTRLSLLAYTNASTDSCVMAFIQTDFVRVETNVTSAIPVANCSQANTSDELEFSVRLSDLNLSAGDSINASFETGNATHRFDLAPDHMSFVSYAIASVAGDTFPHWANATRNASEVFQGRGVLFNATWEDDSALSHYIFATNRTGSWQNTSAVVMGGVYNYSANISSFFEEAGTLIAWRFYANDSAGQWNSTAEQTFTIGGVVWNQTALSFGPVLQGSDTPNRTVLLRGYLNNTNVRIACTGDCNTISQNFTNGDSLNGTSVNVRFNCSTAATGTFFANFSSNSSQDAYAYNISANCTVDPLLPNVTTPRLAPGIPVTADNVTANATVTQPNGETMSVNVTWWVNGSLNYSHIFAGVANGTVVNATLGRGNYSRFLLVVVNYTVNDSSSSAWASASVNISSTPPEQGEPTLTPGSPSDADNLTCNPQSLSDYDGDGIRNITTWRISELPWQIVTMPFEGGSNDTHTMDYARDGVFGRVTGAMWNRSGGRAGGAYHFDGVNDYINTTLGGINVNTHNITILLWVRALPVQAGVVIADYCPAGSCDTSEAGSFVLDLNNGRPQLLFEDLGGANATTQVNDSQWHHLAVRMSPLGSGTVNATLFVDGAREANFTTNLPGTTVPMRLHVGGDSGWGWLNGTIDQFEVYNASLSDAQVYRSFLEGNESHSTMTVHSAETRTGQNWTCQLTSNDGYVDGSLRNASAVVSIAGLPNSTKFDGLTTDFASANLSAVCNMTLENSTNARITWLACTNSTGKNYDRFVNISYNLVQVDPDSLESSHNTTALITLHGINITGPQLVMDGQPCPSSVCTIVSYNQTNGTLVFNVTHFTSFWATASVNLTLWDSNDTEGGGLTVQVGHPLNFTANYTFRNGTDVSNATYSNGTCQVQFNETGSWSSWYNMTYQSTPQHYVFSFNMSMTGKSAWNVSCNSSYAASLIKGWENVTIIQMALPNTTTPSVLPTTINDSSNLTCSYTAISSVNNITNWVKDNRSDTLLLAPFEGGSNGSYTRDYAGTIKKINVSGATWTSAGYLGGSYFFDGGDYLCPDPDSDEVCESIPELNLTGPFSVTAWINWTGVALGFVFATVGSDTAGGFGLLAGDTIYCRTSNGTAYNDRYSNAIINAKLWYHVAIVYNGSLCTIYVNGTDQSSNGGSVIVAGSPNPPYIGVRANLVDSYFDGHIDELRVYNRTLTQQEVVQVMSLNYSRLESSATSTGDAWHCSVTPNNATHDGETRNATALVVASEGGEIVPNVTVPYIIPAAPNETSNLTCNFTTTDSVTNITNWVRNNISDTLLLVPFDGGSNDTHTRDYAGFVKNLMVNGSTWATQSRLGSSYGFDGSNDRICADTNKDGICELPPELNFTRDFTLSAWVNVTGFPDNGIVVSAWAIFEGGYAMIVNTNGQLWCRTDHIDDYVDSYSEALVNVSPSKWRHILVSRNGTSCRTYIDGVDRTIVTGSHSMNRSSRPLYIGARGDTGGEYFQGYIDEVRIYNRSLTTAEVVLLNATRHEELLTNATAIGDAWHCSVTPNNATHDGEMRNSSAAVIVASSNSAPTFTNYPNITPAAPSLDDNLTCAFNTTDSDGEAVYNITSWLRDDYSDALLIAPFEGGSNSSFTKDYGSFIKKMNVSGATWGTAVSAHGGAYYFDGDDYICPDPDSDEVCESIPELNLTGNFTVTAWVNLSTLNLGFVFATVGSDTAGGFGLLVGDTIYCRTSNGTHFDDRTTNAGVLNTSLWYHVAISYNGSLCTIYVNGTDRTTGGGSVQVAGSPNPPYIGVRANLVDSYFNGYIDQVRVYNRTLTYQEIQDDMDFSYRILRGTNTRSGQSWHCSVTPNDFTQDGETYNSTKVSFVGQAPNQTLPRITPAYPVDDSDLTCVANVTDAEGDAVQNITSWWLNNASQLLLLMPFEGGSNSTWTRDYSGYNLNGTVSSGASWNETGQAGAGAYAFDGSANALINASNSTSFLLRANDNFTVEAWVNINDDINAQPQTHAYVASRFSNTNTIGWFFSVRKSGSIVAPFLGTINGSASHQNLVIGSSDVLAGGWHHIAGVYNTTHLTVYTDGALDNTTVRAYDTNFSAPGHVLIGNRDDGLRPVNGSIDEVRIWNRSLTLDEIIAHNASRYFELQSTETQVGDAWQCAVTPNDGSSDGTMLNSSAVVVSGCTTAYDDFYLNANTVLCGGAQFSVTDSGASGVLIVNRSNILLDCNASIINGSKSYTGYGIYNDRFDNITVKNCVIEGYFNALFFVNSSQHNISGNTLSRNRKRPNSNDSGDFIDVWEIPPNTDDGGGGIFLWYVNRSVVSWNNMTDQQNGLQLYNSDRNNITDNNMSDNQGWGIQLDNASYNFVSNNNADDVWNKNSTYCVGVQDNGCDTAGLLILRSSDNNTIVNNTIRQGGDSYFGAGASAAADMLGTNGNYVADNDFSYAWHHGVEHTFAKNNVFERNNVSNARRNGFWLGYSEYTIVRENDMSNDSWGAVDNEMGRHNLYLNNTIFKGGDGIVLYNTNTTNNTIANNTILNTTAEGIKLQNDSFTRIIGNTISGNPVSISIEMASYNITVLNNSITAPDSATHAVLITRSDNATFRGNVITTTAVPAFFVSQSDNLKVFNGPLNVPLTVNDTELMNDSDNARFINVSFDVWNVSVSGDSSLYVGYYLGVNVSNDTGPAANANVTAFGANRSTAFSALTDSSGLVSDQELIQFRVNGSTFNYTDYSLYTVNATWNGLTKNQTVNMTSSQNLVFLFINGPLISGVPNRTINMSFSPPDAWYNLTVNTTDVDNLSSQLTWYIRNETNTSVIDCFIRSGSPGHLNCSAPSARGSTTIFVNVTDGFYWDETSFVITVVNSPPTQGTPQITPASPAADDDLTCVPQSVTDVDGDSVLNITSWALNGASQLLVLMPFEGGSNTTFTRNYMPFGGNGTVSGAVWNSSDGRTGGAYIFNSSAPKIINLSYDIAFNMTDTQPFTVEAWVQVFGWNTSEPRAAIVDRLSNKGASATGWSLNVENASNGGVLRFFIKNATSGSSSETITGSSNIADGRWHHLAGVHDGTNFSIYVDGVLENSSVRRVWKSFNDDSGIDIGQWPGNPERYLNGSIDEVRLWNRSLSAEQILQHNASRYDLLDENETAVDDSWGCSVSPNDGYADGSTLNSSPVAVAGCSTPTDDYYVNRDTLFCSGTYPLADSTGNGVIIINASGVNVTCNGTVITGTDTGNDIGINLSTFGNLTLTGCTLANYSRGVYQESNGDKFTVINDTIVIGPARRINQVEGITLDADSINLTNVLVLNTTANGIRFLLSANSLLVNVRVEGTGTTAVTLSSVGLGVTVRNLTILNCSGTGLSLVSNKISVSNLTVRGCEGNSTSINGALVQETFEDVVIEHGKGIGISMEQSGASPLSGNTFARVRITNMSGRAIFLNYSVNNSFIGLNVTSSGDEGLYLRSGSTGNYINDSRFCSNGDAEQDINDSDSNTFTNVTCDDSTPGGLCAASCSGSFPNVTTPVFAPPAPTTIDNITANTTATDAQSNMTVYFRWLVDGVRVYNHTFSSVVNGSVLNATLGGGNFSRYQLVNVTVFANDSSLASENRSVEVNISNALPTQDAPSVTPASPTTDDNLTCNPQNVSDGDGDPIVNITNWYINNASITLLHLPFEGSSNNTYAKDYSDHGNNVKNNAGGPPFWNRTGGYTGGGMQFPANTNLTTTNGASDFSGADYYTVAAWIKPIGAAAGPGGGDVLRKEATAAMGVSNSAPPTLGAWRYSSGWCGSWALGARTLTFGQWYHAAFRYNGTHVSVFLNGSVDGQTACTGKIDSNSNEMHVGGWSDEFFNGTIDEVLYFNRSLSDAQISSLFAGGLRTIHADTTTTGEQWTCATTPNDGYADGTMKNASVVVGAGNAAPLIVDVNFTAADPLENGTRSVFFSFNVSDTDGAGDLNHSTASVRILSNGIWRNSSSCSQSNYSATETRYNCTVLFNYYDNSSADWRVNASVRDNSSSLAFNDTLNFTYNSLSAMRLSLFTFDFGTLSLGQTAGSAANPLLANNTGNFDFAAINVTGYDLHGTSDRGYSIPAQNFTVNASADSIGLPLTNGTSALIPSGTLPHGAPGGAANRSLWLYVVMPSGGIIAQGYNATELWSLTVR